MAHNAHQRLPLKNKKAVISGSTLGALREFPYNISCTSNTFERAITLLNLQNSVGEHYLYRRHVQY